MPVSYEQLAGYPTFSGKRDELTAEWKVRIAWGDIENFYNDLFPAGGLSALLPGSTVLRADAVSFEPEIGEGDIILNCTTVNAYSVAVAHVQFRAVPFETAGPSNDVIITRRFSAAAEFLTMPSSGLEWENAGGPGNDKIANEDVVAGKLIPTSEHSLTLHYVSDPDFDLLYDLIGHVNDSEFEDAAAETLLFMGFQAEQTVSISGSESPWKIDLTLSHRHLKIGATAVGWNHFYRPNTGEFEKLVTKVGGDEVYPSTDFDDIYDIPQ